ncbi:hypothetical protein GQ53DRAFT_723806 [Thozetella sp. PMI_491]|nr:hypothetical protein GQ53DRAFT_723806 [Thozetella sp. PMI_491]
MVESPTASPPAHDGRSRSPRPLACVSCQQRKIRCDRVFPCSHCTKSGLACVPSTPAPRRPRRGMRQELQDRLIKCEALLRDIGTPVDKSQPPSPPTPELEADDFSLDSLERSMGKLVLQDGKTRFVDNALLGTVYNELSAMKKILESEPGNGDGGLRASAGADDFPGMLYDSETDGDLGEAEPFEPRPNDVSVLWETYLERVNPMVKLIHVPSLEPYIQVARDGKSESLPGNMRTLLLAIYTLSSMAMSQEECVCHFGQPREQAIHRFTRDLRTMLIQQHFLARPDLVLLQALLMYQVALQKEYDNHSAWILNSVSVRIGQKLGIHRDGESLGLPPFETEMRRRLWWYILLNDCRYALESGLSHLHLPLDWEVLEPKNVNDADFHPGQTEPIISKEGPTEMVFQRLACLITKFIMNQVKNLPLLIEQRLEYGSYISPVVQELFLAEIKNLDETMGDFLDKECDPKMGPAHEMSLMTKDIILDRMYNIIKPHLNEIEGGPEKFLQRAFRVSVEGVEHVTRHYAWALRSGFIWYLKLQLPLEMFSFMVGQLTKQQSGPLVERAWAQVDVVYRYNDSFLDLRKRQHHLLGVYVLKAWEVRAGRLAESSGHQPSAPHYVLRLRREISAATTPVSMPSLTPTIGNATTSPQPEDASEAQFWNDVFGNYGEPGSWSWDQWAGDPI